MNILVVNDDGIFAPGIEKLARAAKNFGDVWVVAPKKQCSGMSMKLTLFCDMELTEYEFPVEGVKAWCLDGTPADCVKAALKTILPVTPDYIFSGINAGFNTGRDVLYSGTANAAMEGALDGVQSFAFSTHYLGSQEVCDKYLVEIIRELLDKPFEPYTIWNVNFPGCTLGELKGIRRGVKLADIQLYSDSISRKTDENGIEYLSQQGIPVSLADAPEGTDIEAVLDNYIAIGKVVAPVGK